MLHAHADLFGRIKRATDDGTVKQRVIKKPFLHDDTRNRAIIAQEHMTLDHATPPHVLHLQPLRSGRACSPFTTTLHPTCNSTETACASVSAAARCSDEAGDIVASSDAAGGAATAASNFASASKFLRRKVTRTRPHLHCKATNQAAIKRVA